MSEISTEPRYLGQILAKSVLGTRSISAIGDKLIEDFAFVGGENEHRGRGGRGAPIPKDGACKSMFGALDPASRGSGDGARHRHAAA